MNCPSCGRSMDQGQRFCATCGFDTQGHVPAGQSLSQAQRPEKKKSILPLILVIFVIVVAIVGIGLLSATYVMNSGNQNNSDGDSLPPITGVTVNASTPRYIAAMGYMVMDIHVTNERATYLEIYNDTYVATLSDGSELTGYYEGNLNIKIPPGGTDSFVVKFDSGTWVDIVSIRFADESGYVDITVPH